MWDKILLNEVALKSDAYLKALHRMKEEKKILWVRPLCYTTLK